MLGLGEGRIAKTSGVGAGRVDGESARPIEAIRRRSAAADDVVGLGAIGNGLVVLVRTSICAAPGPTGPSTSRATVKVAPFVATRPITVGEAVSGESTLLTSGRLSKMAPVAPGTTSVGHARQVGVAAIVPASNGEEGQAKVLRPIETPGREAVGRHAKGPATGPTTTGTAGRSSSETTGLLESGGRTSGQAAATTKVASGAVPIAGLARRPSERHFFWEMRTAEMAALGVVREEALAET